MCGIAGFVDPSWCENEARVHLRRMLDLLAHRGPDGEGSLVAAGGLSFGMRRLSIVDLAGGAQPIWNEARDVAVVFNGEIYNHLELRAGLESRGHRFRTHSDTEVLVHLFEEHGERMVEHLRGMFAFALLDSRQERLFIARDHFGQKPLYYTRAEGRFAFASELKSLLALPWVSRERDPAALLDYLAWMSLPPPRTHFRHVWKLPAGHLLTIPLAQPATFTPRRYWSYELRTEPDLTELPPAIEALDATLRDALQVHLRADVPVGVLLSSGLDSRVVTAYAQDLQAEGMQTFTVGFGGADSETEGAAQTAREIRSQHHSLGLGSADLAADLGRVARHLDEPVGDPAAFAVLRVCELAREHVKVLLSGEGSDELFGGYDARYLGMLATLQRSDRLRRLAPLLPAPDPAGVPSRWQRLGARAHRTRASEAISLRIEGLPGDVRHPRGLTAAQLRQLREKTDVIAASLYRRQRDPLSELLALDLDWQLAESLLQKADKMSMAASIELRTPLLDLRVAALAARLASPLKLPPGGPGKLVLRHCLARKLHEPLNRPKRGFPVPLVAWFTGPLRTTIESAIFARDAACLEQLDRGLLEAAWADFTRGAWDGARTIYALWLYEVWAREIANLPAAR